MQGIHAMTACRKNLPLAKRSGLRLWSASLAFAAAMAGSAQATETYYVSPTGNNGNDGKSTAQPWRTITYAVTQLDPGDTLLLMDGEYVEPSINITRSGTAGQPITIRAQNVHQATLSSTANCDPNISLLASYIVLEDFVSAMASHTHCAVDWPKSNQGAAVRAWGGDEFYGAPNEAAPDTPFHHCVIRNLQVNGSPARAVGIKINQDDCLVEDNLIESSLQAFNNKNNVFRNNVLLGHDAWGTGLFGKGGVRNFKAYDNIVFVSEGQSQAIIIGGESDPVFNFDPESLVEAYNSVAYNNVVVNDTGTSVMALGMMNAQDSALFNNVVDGRGLLYLYTPPGKTVVNSNPLIKNNIFSCGGYAVRETTGPKWTYTGTLDLDYNLFYDCLNAPTTQAHGQTADPLFVNPGWGLDWHVPASSPAFNAGTPVSVAAYGGGSHTVDADRDGNPRGGSWSMGIHETPACCDHGLIAYYFNYDRSLVEGDIKPTLETPSTLPRLDANIDFNWGLASPFATINSDYFAVRWTGQLVPPVTGTYEFCTTSDDGIDLWIDEELLIHKWYPQDGSTQWCAEIELTANQAVPFRMEYYDIEEEALVHLTWSYPGQAEVVVPNSAFLPE